MGGSSSKSTKIYQDMLTEVTTNIIMENTTTCQSMGKVSQDINIKGTGKGSKVVLGDITQEAEVVISQTCLQDTKKRSDVQNALMKDLTNKITEKLANMSLQIKAEKSKNQINTNIKNYVNTMMEEKNIAEAFLTAEVDQGIKIEDVETVIGGDIKQMGSIQAINNLSQTAQSETGVQNTIKEVIKNETARIEENPVAKITDSLGAALHNILSIPVDMANSLVWPLIIGVCVLFASFMFAPAESQQNLTGLVREAKGPVGMPF